MEQKSKTRYAILLAIIVLRIALRPAMGYAIASGLSSLQSSVSSVLHFARKADNDHPQGLLHLIHLAKRRRRRDFDVGMQQLLLDKLHWRPPEMAEPVAFAVSIHLTTSVVPLIHPPA